MNKSSELVNIIANNTFAKMFYHSQICLTELNNSLSIFRYHISTGLILAEKKTIFARKMSE